MDTLKIQLLVRLPGGVPLELVDEVTIPPDYTAEDRRHFIATRLERLAELAALEHAGLAPLRHALWANDARAREIERLARTHRNVAAAELLAILETPSDEAILRWGEPPVEAP